MDRLPQSCERNTIVAEILTRDGKMRICATNRCFRGDKECPRTKLNIQSGERYDLCYGIHAEQNALTAAAMSGFSTNGALVRVTRKPCHTCLKSLAMAGVARVEYEEERYEPFVDELMDELDIELVHIQEKTPE